MVDTSNDEKKEQGEDNISKKDVSSEGHHTECNEVQGS